MLSGVGGLGAFLFASTLPAPPMVATSAPLTALAHLLARQQPAHARQVVSDKMQKSIMVAVERWMVLPKYNFRMKRHSKIMAHDENDDCRVGDLVRIEMSRRAPACYRTQRGLACQAINERWTECLLYLAGPVCLQPAALQGRKSTASSLRPSSAPAQRHVWSNLRVNAACKLG